MPNEFQLFPEFGDLFGKEAEPYAMSLARRFGEVKVLGMPRPVPLLSLYVRANILEKITSRIGATVEEMEKAFDFDRRPFGKRQETKDGEEIVNQLEKFIVLGKPGAGKTTFLKYLTLSILHAETKIQKRRLPIFITLRDWADRRTNLMDYIAGQFDINGFEQAGPYIERALKSGKCLVFFDGLDEVSQEANIDGITRDIRDFTDKYSDNQFIISCRIAAYNHSFDQFTDVEIADFNEKQIEAFVGNWFHYNLDKAQECLQHLKASSQFQELATVPLLLTLLCMTYENNNEFPQRRASLYQEALKVLLEQWDEKRPGGRVKRDEIYKNLSVENKEALLTRIGYGTFLENQYFIEEDHLAKMIQNFVKNLPQYQEEKVLPDGAHILRQIEAQHGILVQQAKGVYSFAHLTFQEYFTAKHIADHNLNETLENLVQEHLYDDKWKEVFLLVAGMLHNASELLLLMLKINRKLLQVPKLNALMRMVAKALLPVESKYTNIARKCLVIILAISPGHRIRRDIAILGFARGPYVALCFAHSATSPTLKIKHKINPIRKSKNNQDQPTDSELIDSYLRGDPSVDLADEMGLNLDLIDANVPSPELNSQIASFLSGNILIAQCLSSAAYLSKPTREHVLSKMLAPLEEGE